MLMFLLILIYGISFTCWVIPMVGELHHPSEPLLEQVLSITLAIILAMSIAIPTALVVSLILSPLILL